ncbi:MAG: PadR family transcriptional regulator [Thermoplasmata archaeon]
MAAPLAPRRPGPGGLVGIYALHLMSRGPIYGWQVAERIASVTHNGWRPGAGAIYPILKALVARGFARTMVRDGTKLYQITPHGRARVRLAKDRMRDGAGRWVNLRLLVFDMLGPVGRDDWAIDRLRGSLRSFTELIRSEEAFPRVQERTRLRRAAVRELRRALVQVEGTARGRAPRSVKRPG